MKSYIQSILATTIAILFTLSANAQCIEDSHTPFENNGWKSCQTSVGPVPERGDKHWLMYDFGEEYKLSELDYWNHNVWGETQLGAREIIIDYSSDQQTWTTLPAITLEQAPGSWKYTGVKGIDLGGIICRYLLITVVDTYDGGDQCAAISELRFQLDEFTSIDHLYSNKLSVAPNPTSSHIVVDVSNLAAVKMMTVTNTAGQEVRRISVPPADAVQIDVQDLEAGMYYVTVFSGGKSMTESFVKID